MAAPRRRRAIVGAVVIGAVLLPLVAWAIMLVMDPDGEGASGAGFTYKGDFYALSGAEVRPDRLGEVLNEAVTFQDTSTQVRLITGVSADTAVAALINVPGDGPEGSRHAWLLLSPDPHLAADPWSDTELSLAVQPTP